MRGMGPDAVSSVWTVGFILLRYSVVCCVESLSLFYLLLISWFVCTWRSHIDKLGIFHVNQTSRCVLIRVRLVPLNMFKPSSVSFCWPIQGGDSFVDPFCYLCFMFSSVMLSCLFLAALWSPSGNGLISWLSWFVLLCFCHFPIWCSGSDVVLGYIDSWSRLPLFL